jgi:hypothetical protein
MVRNENVRFGRYIDIEVSYKILWLEVTKLHYPACFQKGLFGGCLSKNTFRPLGVKLGRTFQGVQVQLYNLYNSQT